MIKFADYLGQYKRKFVCLSYTDETVKSLQTYCKENGFDLTSSYNGSKQAPEDFGFHTTIFYSDSYHNMEDVEVSVSPFEVKPDSLQMFGPKKNIPVLKLKLNKQIANLRELFEAQGFTDSWPEYKPHVSLSYNFTGDDINKVKLPSFPLIVNSFKIKDGSTS